MGCVSLGPFFLLGEPDGRAVETPDAASLAVTGQPFSMPEAVNATTVPPSASWTDSANS